MGCSLNRVVKSPLLKVLTYVRRDLKSFLISKCCSSFVLRLVTAGQAQVTRICLIWSCCREIQIVSMPEPQRLVECCNKQLAWGNINLHELAFETS